MFGAIRTVKSPEDGKTNTKCAEEPGVTDRMLGSSYFIVL